MYKVLNLFSPGARSDTRMVGIISPFSRGGSRLREVQHLALCHTGRELEAELGSARAELAQSASCRGRGGSKGTEVGGVQGAVASSPGASPAAPRGAPAFGGCWQTELGAK